jgi:hypothetical protein
MKNGRFTFSVVFLHSRINRYTYNSRKPLYNNTLRYLNSINSKNTGLRSAVCMYGRGLLHNNVVWFQPVLVGLHSVVAPSTGREVRFYHHFTYHIYTASSRKNYEISSYP